ncbi:hypothetical protein [Methylobacterium iners]|uniref:Uncharacterized protein n=1 Tax=Methylobacterium iners TaxID=418707 RepID=A0ABQ4RZQ1_9HYPH|nr:hypothetical protein [Methylobacterium iners]GJD94995.1 hypothetical protein OCOJLMKI_2203 [Methylobacterium iners]
MTDKVVEVKDAGTKAAPSPEALLKEAVAGARKEPAATAAVAKSRLLTLKNHPQARSLGLALGALTLGAIIGASAMSATAPRAGHTAAFVAQLSQGLEAGRLDAARLSTEIGRVGEGVLGLREENDAARQADKARIAALTDRLARLEQTLVAKIGSLAERQEQLAREQGAKVAALGTQIERQAQAPAAIAPQASRPAPAEPVQTGAIPDAKPKPAAIETWAVREVYDGIAVLEDRKRRLVEVGIGDTVPGAGRVETIERRGRAWTVVTKQGLITPQAW